MNKEDLDNKLNRESITLAPAEFRLFAFLIDEMLISLLFTIIYYNHFVDAKNFEETILLVNQLVPQALLLKIIYQSFFVWYYGASLGKIICKIKIISTDLLDTPSLSASITRAVTRVFSEYILYLGFLWGLFDKNRQTWHDKIARTLVVNV